MAKGLPESVQVSPLLLSPSSAGTGVQIAQFPISLGRNEIVVALAANVGVHSDGGSDAEIATAIVPQQPVAGIQISTLIRQEAVLWNYEYQYNFATAVAEAKVSDNKAFDFPYPVVMPYAPWLWSYTAAAGTGVYLLFLLYYLKMIVSSEQLAKMMVKSRE